MYREFLSGYVGYHKLSHEEILSFPYWVAIRHFQLQATIFEIYGVDCIDEGFIDREDLLKQLGIDMTLTESVLEDEGMHVFEWWGGEYRPLDELIAEMDEVKQKSK